MAKRSTPNTAPAAMKRIKPGGLRGVPCWPSCRPGRTRKPFATVDNVPGRGGSINNAGPTVVGGMVFVNSGYGFLGGAEGNVLLAFTVDGR